MKLNLRITAGLLLLVQIFHMASLQNSTDSPGRTIQREWLRDLAKNKAGSQNAATPEEDIEYNQGADATAAESSNDYSSGIASGSMAEFKEEDEKVARQDDNADDGSDDLTAVTTTGTPTNPSVTTKDPELPDTTVSPSNATTVLTNSSSINATEAEEEFNTTTTTLRNSTSSPHHSNHTDLLTTTSAPEGNGTQESTTRDQDTWSNNATGSANTTTVTTTATPEMNGTSTSSSPTTVFSSSTTSMPAMNGTSTSSSPTTVFSSSTTSMPEMNGTSTVSLPTTVFSSETTESSPTTTTAVEKANRTDEGSASGGNPERGLESDPHRSKRNGAWGAVLGTAVAVAFVGLVAYVILKRKHQKGFSHRKLVEEYPSDPVLRLDNSEPLDLNLGGSAYYNPALQGDNIQMSNLPGRR